MSVETDIAKKRRATSRFRLFLLLGVLGLIVVMAMNTKIVASGSKEDLRAEAFSPEAYGKKEFPKIAALIEKQAVDAKTLLDAIFADKDAAAEKYGKPGSIGPMFSVRLEGVVAEGEDGIFVVQVKDFPKDILVRVQTGPAINGTDVRDATGTVDFGQFTNQIEYQDVGSALNNEVKSQILGNIDRDHLTGKSIQMVGVFQLFNPGTWLLTPVAFKVLP